MNTIANTAFRNTILAVDLGKYKPNSWVVPRQTSP
jgi:hypothetical protein